MVEINLEYDLGDVSSEYEPVPADTYIAKIVECDLEKASTGKDMLRVKWEIVEGDFQGRPLYDNVVLSVSWKVKQYADAAGIESGTALDTKKFMDTEASVRTIVTESQEYGKQNKVKRVSPIE